MATPGPPTVREYITPERIARVASVIRPYTRLTPTLQLDAADLGIACRNLTLKLELFQHAGSFKTRGAFANLLLRQIPAAGVAAASGGNHGAAVAYAAQTLGVPAHIFVPKVASPSKVDLIRRCGAELVIAGERYADSLEACNRFIVESGALSIHAFDQAETLLGQGTVGYELNQQEPELDTLFVAVGGGGLIGGIASWFEGKVKIIGVEPEAAPTLARALKAGCPVDAEAGGIAADSLAPRRVGEIMFPIAQKFVDTVILVTDDEIRHAQETLWKSIRIVSEPGGAAALSALLSKKYIPTGNERVGVLICGGNTSAVNFCS